MDLNDDLFKADDEELFVSLIKEHLAKGAAIKRGISALDYVHLTRDRWNSCNTDNVYAIKMLVDPLVQPEIASELPAEWTESGEPFCELIAAVDSNGRLMDAPSDYAPPSYPGVRLCCISLEVLRSLQLRRLAQRLGSGGCVPNATQSAERKIMQDRSKTRRTNAASENKPWREFEKLVAMIEFQAAPHGAVVTSPDRIRDLVTRRLREVDASIRYRVGTVDVLITIECRSGSRRADDRWIEQLAAKRQKIGAAKTIAVSAAGFTDSARLTAAHHCIDVCNLSEIQPSDVAQWFLSNGVVHVFREVGDIRCTVDVSDGEDLRSIDVDAFKPAFWHEFVASPFPPMIFVKFLELTQPERFAYSIPPHSGKSHLDFDLDATASNLIPVPPDAVPHGPVGPLLVEAGESKYRVTRIRLSMVLCHRTAEFSFEQGQHHLYANESGSTVLHSAFKGVLFDQEVRFDHQIDDVSGELSVVARFGEKTKPRET